VSAFDAFKVKGLFTRLEFNYVRPFTYTHSDTHQNYSHFGEPLAHPYGSNFQELIAQVEYRKNRWIGRLHMSTAMLGSDTGLYSSGNNIFRTERERFEVDGVVDASLKNYGHYVGDVVPVRIFYCEVGGAWLVDPHTGMSIEASYTFRSRVPEGAENEISHIFRVGISTHFRDRYKDQEVRYMLN
jgi:hypothetical protein